MKETIIGFKTAVSAKELGFNEVTESCYDINGLLYSKMNHRNDLGEGVYSAPTQSLLQKWLREVYNIRVFCIFEIIDDVETAWTWKIVEELEDGVGRQKDSWDFYKETNSFEQMSWWAEYEDALEKGLMEGLKIAGKK